MFVALPKTVLEYDESLPLCFQNGNDVSWRREMKWVKAEMPTMKRKKKKTNWGLCPDCLDQKSPGKDHHCNKKTRDANIDAVLSLKGKEELASKFIGFFLLYSFI